MTRDDRSERADDPPETTPLARLFAMAYRQLIGGLHERLRERGWTDVRPAFGFVLLAARDRPTTSTELAELMGTTKQAASKVMAAMAAAGYVQAGASRGDGRQRPVELSARGRDLLGAVEAIYADLEREWSDVIGAARVERVRHDVARVLRASHGGDLPAVRPTW